MMPFKPDFKFPAGEASRARWFVFQKDRLRYDADLKLTRLMKSGRNHDPQL